MGLTVVSMLVLFTGFVHMSENMSENARVRRMEESLVGSAEDGKIPFHDMFYFIVISLTTVGYGDITVYSLTGAFKEKTASDFHLNAGFLHGDECFNRTNVCHHHDGNHVCRCTESDQRVAQPPQQQK